MKTNKDLIIEPNAAIEGRKYREEKPWSCKYCYWWGGKKKGCSLKQCHYLLPEKKKAVKTTPCGGCPYGKHVPCIGYCIARLYSEMKERTWVIAGRSKSESDQPEHPGSQNHCQCAKSSPSEVPGNRQPQETESKAGENGRKDRTGSGERKGKNPKKD